MESWFGTNALPNTYYGKSDKGWVDSEAFAKWFENFLQGCQGTIVVINL